MKQARIVFLSALFPLALIGCGSDDSGPNGTAGSGGNSPQCKEDYSGYAGDCLKLAPPETGLQLHFGPSNYDDKADVAKYLLEPHKEHNICLFMTTPNEEDLYFSEYHGTVRPGSHHMIVFGAAADAPGIPTDGTLDVCQAWPGTQFHFVVGAQNGMGPEGGRIDFPGINNKVPEESKDTAYVLKAKSRVAYQVHYINNTEAPILQESWANFVGRRREDVKELAAPLWWIGGLVMYSKPIEPGTKVTVTSSCTNKDATPKRIIGMTAHAHAHTIRFSAFSIPKGTERANRKLVYQEFNWAEAQIYYYDTVNKNPVTDTEKKIAGASSGPLILNQGDTIEWECEVQNNETFPLSWGNEAYDAEMCNIFGASAPGNGDPWTCLSP